MIESYLFTFSVVMIKELFYPKEMFDFDIFTI